VTNRHDRSWAIVLVEPSGCGKSTTLHCIAGLEDVTEGRIRIGGIEVNDMTAEERNIAMVFQNYALYPHMTARENMSFGLRMSTDLPNEEVADRVERTTSMMGIEDLLDKKPKELSGGQQQRVALGRAIVREPEVFLLDEPLSNLDAKLRTRMRTEIQQLQRELGVTAVYVTHDQTEAMTMGDRIAILDGGELQQLGTPLECYTVSEKFLCTIWPPVAQRLTTDSILRAGERLRRGLHRRALDELLRTRTRGKSTRRRRDRVRADGRATSADR